MIRGLVLVCALILGGCSTLSSLTPSGPQVNTNAQVGKENTQQVVGQQTNTNVQGDQRNSQVDAQSVESVQIANNSVPLYMILLVILGIMLPTPTNMYKEIKSWFKRKDKDADSKS